MKRQICALLPLVLIFAAAARAEPAEDLEVAIRALLDQPNFSWKVTLERTETGRRYDYEGKTERGGFTVVTTARRTLSETTFLVTTNSPWCSFSWMTVV